VNTLRTSALWPWAGVATCFSGAFVLAALLTASAPIGPDEGGSVTDLLFGSSRRVLSAELYDRADAYFHRGVAHREKRVERHDWIQRLRADISPEAHRHAEGLNSSEIIPWLRLATDADPHNVEAWLVASFWLETGMQRPDLAEQVLREAQRHNPGDYRVLLDRARLYLRTARFSEGANVLDAALARWPGSLDPDDRQSLLDKAELLTYRAFLHEIEGHPREAAAGFKNVLAIFPERTYIEARRRELESGTVPSDSARALLERGVRQATHATCDAETDGEHQGHGHAAD
jgi:tetratricopeptide (TPR) repeat protein